VLKSIENVQVKANSLSLVVRTALEFEEMNQLIRGGLLNHELCDLYFTAGTVKWLD
jgi:hypothetical protein